jgi:hypothetical protein
MIYHYFMLITKDSYSKHACIKWIEAQKARGQAAANLIDSLKYNLTCSIIMVNIKREVHADGAAKIYKRAAIMCLRENEARMKNTAIRILSFAIVKS